MSVLLLVPAYSYAIITCPSNPQDRHAPCTAYPDEQKEIMDAIDVGMKVVCSIQWFDRYQSLSFFRRLHFTQSNCPFSKVVRPPLIQGVT